MTQRPTPLLAGATTRTEPRSHYDNGLTLLPHRFPIGAPLAVLASTVDPHVHRDPIGGVGDHLALLLVEIVEEELTDQIGVLAGCCCQRLAARSEQDRLEAASIFGHRFPGNPTPALQPVGDVGEPLCRRDDLAGQHRHPHPTTVPVEADQDLVVAVGHSMVVAQVLGQDLLEEPSRVEEAGPRSELCRIEVTASPDELIWIVAVHAHIIGKTAMLWTVPFQTSRAPS